ncbi:lysyl-tRNA synthetase, class II [Plasmodium inui San Antonio 1]|uniref:lysine--tRNA ligase n=1 Tax=Plasmodium inui San Antonio 1 TaxID=1237626 RepID=W7A9Z3_9APIC|nr:lysyl-tRNA synthetase, class II [Plasmodium inui San Antonio 1]EUD65959.1 lysyl-tRNA synthetase, class II [Plasmodium inui San Antonio 1]
MVILMVRSFVWCFVWSFVWPFLWSFSLICNPSSCFKHGSSEAKGVLTIGRRRSAFRNRKKKFTLQSYGKEFSERVKKLNLLSDVLKIDAYPSSFIKRTTKIDELKKKYGHLESGEKDENKKYVIYGRVTVKRNDGMFLNVQDDSGTVQIYVDAHVVLKGGTKSEEKRSGCLATDGENDRGKNNTCSGAAKIGVNSRNCEGNDTHGEGSQFPLDTQGEAPRKGNSISVRKIIEVGDFVAIKGFVRKSQRGELTLHTEEIFLLTKSLLPLPDKYKGMKDVEYKYRKRYLDILTNKEEKEKILTRFEVIQEIRKFLLKKKYLEVDTPILQSIPGGASAKPFETFLKSLNSVLYLRIAPELYLKKLIISGISEQIFEFSKCFRNEGLSTIHNPEFTLLEIYKAYSNYKYMITFTERLIKTVAKKFSLHSSIDKGFLYEKRWKKISFMKILKDYTCVDFLNLSFDQAYNEAKKLNVTFDQGKEYLNWGLVVQEVFKRKVEPFLDNHPVHIYHLPADTSPLAKTLSKNKKLSERFETYIGNMEIANGYSEEANPLMQERKFISQYTLKYKKVEDRSISCTGGFAPPDDAHSGAIRGDPNQVSTPSGEEFPQGREQISSKMQHMQHIQNDNREIDYDYVTALMHGLPPTGGLGIGIDRLCMLLTNSSSIKNVLPFPIIKPQ